MLSKKKKIKRKIVASVCSATMLTSFFAPGIVYTRDSKADAATYSDFNHNLIENKASSWSGDGASYTASTFIYDSANRRPEYGTYGGALMGTEFGFSDSRILSAIDNEDSHVPYYTSYSGTYTNTSTSPITMTVNLYFAADANGLYESDEPDVTNSIELTGESGNFTVKAQTDNIPPQTRYVRVDIVASYPELADDESCRVVVNDFLNIVQDTEAPSIEVTTSPSSWTNTPITVTVSELDDDIGVYAIYDNNGDMHEGNEYEFTVEEAGPHEYSFYGVDYAGNRSEVITINVDYYDDEAPDAPVVASISSTDWTNVAPHITFEEFGEYEGSEWSLATVGGAEYSTFDGYEYTVTEEGVTSLVFVTVDLAGNVSVDSVPVTVKYDNTAPEWTMNADSVVDLGNGTNLVTVVPTDALSGVNSVKYTAGKDVTIDNATATWTDITSDCSFIASAKSGYTVMITDNAGNINYYNVSTSFAPVIDQVDPQSFDEDYGTGSIEIGVRDDSVLDNLTIDYELSDGLADVFEVAPSISIENGKVYFNFTLAEDANTNGLTDPSIKIIVTDDDEIPNTSEMTFDFVVNPVNDPPVAYDISETTTEGVAVTIDVINHATNRPTDIDRDTLSLTNDFTQPANGTVTIVDGKFVFTPTNPNWYGTTSFTYTVTDGNSDANTNTSNVATITIVVNDDPSVPIARPDSVTMDEDTKDTDPITYIDVLANDTDADVFEGSADYLTVIDVTGATLGTATIDATGKIHYVPTPDAYGTDTLVYTIADTQGNEVTSTLTVNILPINDAPEIIGAPDTLSVDENTGAEDYAGESFSFTINDIDNENEEIMVVVSSDSQTVINARDIHVTRDGDTVSVEFVPVLNSGEQTVTLTITVTDGAIVTEHEVTVNINDINVAPVANDDDIRTTHTITEGISANIPVEDLLVNDTDADRNTLTITAVSAPEGAPFTVELNGSNITITGNDQVYGDFSFTYTVSDNAISGALTDDATVKFRITEVDDAPTITIDNSQTYSCLEYTTLEDTRPTITIPFSVSDEDTSIELLDISATYANEELIESISVSEPDAAGNCEITIVPTAHEYGISDITVKVSDGHSTAIKHVTAEVVNVQDKPVARNDEYTVEAGVSTSMLPTENDYDYDEGQFPTIVGFTTPAHGTLTWSSDNTTLVYTAELEYEGPDSFVYTLEDPVTGEKVTATVNITVEPTTQSLVRINAPAYLVAACDSSVNFDFSVVSNVSNASIERVNVASQDSSIISSVTATEGEGGNYSAVFTTTANGGYTYIEIEAEDSNGNTGTFYVKVFVKDQNAAPVASDYDIRDTVEFLEGSSTARIYLDDMINANACSDPDGDPISIANITPVRVPTGAYLTVDNVNGRQCIIYHNYDSDFFGDISFKYTVTDGIDVSDEATIRIRYTNVPDTPVGRSDTLYVRNEENASVTVSASSLLNNDYDDDNGFTGWNEPENRVVDTLSIVYDMIEGPQYGHLTINDDGSITYTRDVAIDTQGNPDNHAADSFYYYVTDGTKISKKILVSVIEDYDYLYGGYDQYKVMEEDNAGVSYTITAGRHPYCGEESYLHPWPDGNIYPGNMQVTYTQTNPLLGEIVPVNGARTYKSDTFTYIPNPDLYGSTIVTATYTVMYFDREEPYTRTATQKIHISVTPIDDAPVFTSGCSVSVVPDDSLAANDPRNEDVTYNESTNVWTCNEYSTLVFDLYYEDIDNLDSELNFSVVATNPSENHAPVIQESDINFDVDGRVPETSIVSDTANIRVSNGAEPGHIQATVTLVENSFGDITVSFGISDGIKNGEPKVFNIHVAEVDEAPDAQDIAGEIIEDSSFEVCLNSNNYIFDPDTVWEDQRIEFVSDGTGTISTDEATGVITYVKDCGVYTYNPDTALVTFNPTHNHSCGQESATGCSDCCTITYRVYTEGRHDTSYDEATIKVHIVPVNDEPFIYNVPPYVITSEDSSVEFEFDAYDVEGLGNGGASITIEIDSSDETILEPDTDDVVISGPTTVTVSGENGDAEIDSHYKVTLTPKPDSNGTVRLKITVSDDDGSSKVAYVDVIVSSVNDIPKPSNYEMTVQEINDNNATIDESYQINVLTTGRYPNNRIDVETLNANIRVIDVTKPTYGTVRNLGGGVLQYIPNPNINSEVVGTDSFIYTVKDADGATNIASVTITIEPDNTAPTAADYTLSVVEGHDTSIDLTTLVTDVEIDSGESGAYEFSFVYNPESPAGTVTLAADGKTLVYNADQQIAENVTETVTYTVKDGEGGEATGTITINVTAVPDPPKIEPVADNVTANYTWTMYEDQVGEFEIKLSDPDTSINNLMFVYTLSGNEGRVNSTDITVSTVGNSKILKIKPIPNQSGEFDINAVVRDNYSTRDITIHVIILPVNDIPVAENQSISTNEDTSVDGQLVASDIEDETDLTYALATAPAHGTVTVNEDGSFTYEPNGNYHGTDSFTFTATDRNTPDAGVSEPATVTITVKPVNDEPEAFDFEVTVNEKIDDTYTPNLIDVIAHVNDDDIATDDEVITITDVTAPAHGTATIVTGDDGKQYISYVPELFNNYDVTITYTVEDAAGVPASAEVTIKVTQVDTIPGFNGEGNDGTPNSPKWTVTEECAPTSLDVLANDDVDSLQSLNEGTDKQNLTIDRVVSITSGAGTATVVGNKIQYTPATDFYTTAGNPVEIVYEMHDDADPDRKVQFTAYVAVRNVNDAPSIESIDDVEKREDCDPFEITAIVSDIYNETAAGDLVVSVSYKNTTLISGIQVVSNVDGTVTLRATVNPNAYGVAEVTVKVQDLGLNDSGTNKLSDTTTFEIIVYPVDDMPDPMPDSVYVDENGENPGSDIDTPYIVVDGGIIVDVINNDDVDLMFEGDDNIDILADSLVADPSNPANNHSVSIVPNQTFTEHRYNTSGDLEDYDVVRSGIQVIPDSDWSSSVPVTYAYTYRVQDTIINPDTGVSSVEYKTGTFTVTINPVNDAPEITINQTVDSIFEDDLGDLGDGWTTIGTITVNDEETAVSVLKDNTVVDWSLYSETTEYTPNINIFDNDSTGVRIVNDNGTLKIQVHPHKDENGYVTLGFTVTDDDATNPLSASATIDLEVIPVQDAPANGDDFETVAEGSTTMLDVTANDDVDIATQGQAVTILSVSQPAAGRGTTSIVNNQIQYVADENFYCVGTVDEDGVYSDAVTFTYVAQDIMGDSAEFTVKVNVTPVNDPPVITEIYGKAHTTTLTTGENQDYEYVYVVVEDPDTPWDQITLSYTSSARVVNVRQGGITQKNVAMGSDDNTANPNTDTSTEVNQAIFTLLVHPNGKFNGTTTLTFTANDHESAHNLSEAVQVPFTVTFVNDPPIAVADNLTDENYNEGTTITGLNVIENDEDEDLSTNPEIERLTILDGSVVFVDPEQEDIGTFTIEEGGQTLKFTPNADHLDWNGTIQFKYTVVDHDGAPSTSGICNLVINPVNDAPVAWNDYEATVDERCSDTGSVSVNIMWHNYDVDIDATRWGVDPADDSATPVRLWPTAIADEDMNETAGYTDGITFVGFNGDNFKDGTNTSTITFDSATGMATYTPALHFNGDDVVTFTIKDSTGATSIGTVTFHVTPVEDDPEAVNDTATVDEDDSVVINVLDNDNDIDSYTNINLGAGINDGTLTVSLPTVADAENVLPAHGTVTTNGTTITYTPFDDYYGDDTFTYIITNMDGNTDIATVDVTVDPVNDDPEADDATVNTDTNGDALTEDTGVGAEIDLATIVHDMDRDGSATAVNTNETLTYSINVITASNVSGEDWSTWVTLTGSTLSFTPGDNFNGEFKVEYTVTDSGNAFDTAVVTFVVAPVKDPPTANDDTASVAEDGSVEIFVLTNDIDIDSDANLNRDLTERNDNTRVVSLPTAADAAADATIVMPAHGTVTTNGTTITYTPFDDYYGDDTFTYIITNKDGLTDTAVVTVTVGADNDDPEADDATVTKDTDGNTLTEDSGVGASIDLATLVRDVDLDGSATAVNTNETHTYSINVLTTSNNANEDWSSWVTLTGSVLSFTPGDNFNGEFKVEYTVTDAAGASDTAVVTFVVTAVEDDPEANNDTATVDEDDSVIISVLTNDVDIDSDTNLNRDVDKINDNTREVSLPTAADAAADATIVMPAHGTVTTNGTTITYTPFDDYYGDDTFTYIITNMDERTDTATVTVTVNSVNDDPEADDATVDTDTNDNALTEDSGVGASIDLATLVRDVDLDGSATALNTNETHTYSINVLTTSNNANEDWSSWVTLSGSVLSFTPGDNFNGEFEVEYTVTDSAGASDTAVVTFVVTAVEDDPEANNDTATVDEDDSVVINVLDNDIDIDSDTNLNRDADKINDNTREVSLPTVADAAADATIVLPAHGTVTTNGTTVTYEPFDDYYGTDSFTYIITNMDERTDTATVTVTVKPVNDLPTADNATVDTDINDNALTEDSGVGASIDLATIIHDIDRDGSTTATNTSESFTYSIRVLTTSGVAGTNWNGWATLTGSVLSFTPGANFNGEFKVEYTVTDSGNESATAVVTFVVTAVEDDPEANNDTATVDEDDSVVVEVLKNDNDNTDSSAVWNRDEDERNDNSLTVSKTLVTEPAHGTAVVNDNGTITYTPDHDFNGQDSFEYRIFNKDNNSDTAVVTITVNPVKDPPTAVDDTASVDEDGSVTINVIANDSDTDSDETLNLDTSEINNGVITVTNTTKPAHGSASIVGNQVVYEPDDDFNGTDSFKYTITNSDNLTATATVTVTVNPIEDNPKAVDDTATVIEDTPTNIYAASNDKDIDSVTELNLNIPARNDGTITISAIVSGPSHGTATIDNITNSILYTPADNYNGPDTITYKVTNMDGNESNVATISITVTAAPDEPECVDDTATVDEDSFVSIDVVANDINVDGDGNINIGDTSHTSHLTVTGFTNGTYGTVTIDEDNNKVVYTPNPDFNGTDSFTYTVTNDENLTATGTVNVTINPVEDDPTAENDINNTVNENGSLTIDPTLNDSDTDSDPDLNKNLVKINDGTLNVISVGTPAHGTVSRVGNNITYTPTGDYNGPDSFTYTIENMDGNTDTATVYVRVAAQPDKPTANDDYDSVNEDGSVVINVVNNDYNTDADPVFNFDAIHSATLTITGFGSTQHGGTVSITTDNQIKYTPAANYNGTDRFTYTITNDENLTATATVYITVVPVEDDPTANDDTATVDEDGTVEIDVTANDTDTDSDTDLNLNLTEINDNRRIITDITVDAQHGTVEIDKDNHNTIHYTPDPDFNGVDSFEYEITNMDGNTDTAKVVVTVNPIEDDPVTENDTVSTNEDVAVTFDVRTNDTDVDSDPDLNLDSSAINTTPLVVTIVDDVTHGTLQILANGTLKYTPDDNFNGEDTFTYYVTNEDGNTSNTSTVVITVVPVEDDPTANDDTATVDEDGTVEIDVTANDSDIDSDTSLNLNSSAINDNRRVITDITVDAQHGTVEIDKDNHNTIHYTPDPDFNGEDSFEYEITNMDGNTDTAKVVVTVVPVEDDPTAVDDTATVDEDDSVEIDVVNNDSDTDSDGSLNLDLNEINDGTITIVGVTEPEHGTAEITDDNKILYTPDPDFNGHDSFEYTIANSDGNESTATVVVTINPINDDPVAVDYMASTLEDYPIVIKPLVGCSDVDYDTDLNEIPDDYELEVIPESLVGNMEGSTIEYDPATDRLTYTPAPGFVGVDSFTYTIIDNKGGEATATITITVLASDYTIVIDREVVDFDDVTAEYEEAPAPEVLTITNLGNKPVTPSIPELENYIIVGDVPEHLWPGESFTVTVQPKPGLSPDCYDDTFVVTTVEGTGDSCELEFNVLDIYYIEAIVPEGGTVNHENLIEVSGGSTVTYTFTPDEGYVVVDVLIDGVSIGSVDEYTFVDIDASHTVEVVWEYRPTSTPTPIPTDTPTPTPDPTEAPEETPAPTEPATPTPPSPVKTGEEASLNLVKGLGAIALAGICLGVYGIKKRKHSSDDEE